MDAASATPMQVLNRCRMVAASVVRADRRIGNPSIGGLTSPRPADDPVRPPLPLGRGALAGVVRSAPDGRSPTGREMVTACIKSRCTLAASCRRGYLFGPVQSVRSASHVTGEVQRSRTEVRAKSGDYSGDTEGLV